MNIKARNISILEHILEYCEDIHEIKKETQNSFETFYINKVYRHAASMCILQIGELSNKLSDDFKTKYNVMPWRSIKDMRNIMAHDYGVIDAKILWDTISNDIPELESYCQVILKDCL